MQIPLLPVVAPLGGKRGAHSGGQKCPEVLGVGWSGFGNGEQRARGPQVGAATGFPQIRLRYLGIAAKSCEIWISCKNSGFCKILHNLATSGEILSFAKIRKLHKILQNSKYFLEDLQI